MNIVDAGSSFDALDDLLKHQTRENDAENKAARDRSVARVLDWLMRHPILLKYIQHIKGSNSSNTLPEHAIGERLYAMYTVGLAAQGKIEILAPPMWDMSNVAPDYLQRTAAGFLMLLLKTNVYLWSDKMEKLADAAPLPTHTVSKNVLPFPTMFWSRETRYTYKVDGEVETVANNWLAFFHHIDCVFVVGDASNHEQQTTRLAMDLMHYGGVWPHDYHSDEHFGRILKRCAFLSSPFIDSDRRRMTRTMRRQLERDFGYDRDDVNAHEVSVVMLRRRQVSKQQKQASSEPTGVEWQHHWWVSSFYRAQWYPSEQAHRVIWIAPFLKGDMTKPLLTKVYNVVR